MRKCQKMKQLSFVWLLLIGLLSSSVMATNGYFRHGYGIQYRGLGGAGLALYLGPLGIANNPAGAAYLGNQFDIGFSLFNPNRQYTVTGTPSGSPGTFPLAVGTVESSSSLFLIPTFGLNYALPGGSHALNISFFGNGGMNTNYQTKTFNNPMLDFEVPTGVNLAQMFGALTYSRELVKNHALGVTAIFAYQRFQAEGLYAFGGFSTDATNLTNNEHSNSTGFGARLGYMGEWLPGLSVGAAYQTKINMSEFEEYAGLFAGQGDFDIPANWSAGLAYRASDVLTFVADVQQILYSDVNAVGNPLNLAELSPVMPDGATPNPNFQGLGSDLGSGFGWEDVTVYKFGVQWQTSSSTTLRGGYSYGKQPITESEVMFNILAPGVVEQHLTLGLSQALTSSVSLNAAFMHALSKKCAGVNPMEPQQTIELEMNQFEGDIGISYAF